MKGYTKGKGKGKKFIPTIRKKSALKKSDLEHQHKDDRIGKTLPIIRRKQTLDTDLTEKQKTILKEWVSKNKDWTTIDDLPNDIFHPLVERAGDDIDQRVEIQVKAIKYMKSLKDDRSKQSLDIPRSKLNYNKGLLTNEANELEETLELRKEDRERIHEQDVIMDKLTKKMFNIIFDFENGHNDDITMEKYNGLKSEFNELLTEFEDAEKERDKVEIGLNDDNKNLVRKIDKVQDILFDIGN